MIYTIVSKLPKDCICVDDFPFPFKFSGDKLYVYEPDVDCFGDAVWFRRRHDIKCNLAVKLLELIS